MNENSENQSKICTLVTKKRWTGPLVSGKEGEKSCMLFAFPEFGFMTEKTA